MFKSENSFLNSKNNRRLLLATFATIFIGSFVYHFSEEWSWLDSIYFSVITLTTVGYGDFSPQSNFGKIFTIFYVLTGIGLIFGFINELYQHRVQKKRKPIKSKNNEE